MECALEETCLWDVKMVQASASEITVQCIQWSESRSLVNAVECNTRGTYMLIIIYVDRKRGELQHEYCIIVLASPFVVPPPIFPRLDSAAAAAAAPPSLFRASTPPAARAVMQLDTLKGAGPPSRRCCWFRSFRSETAAAREDGPFALLRFR